MCTTDGTDPFTIERQLCNDDGLVDDEYLESFNLLRLATWPRACGPVTDAFACTGHAHLAGEHIRCTSPAHQPKREPGVGDVLVYRLSGNDIARLERRRAEAGAHGNQTLLGQTVPLVVVRTWPYEYASPVTLFLSGADGAGFTPDGDIGVNGQVLLDGPDTLWVTSAPQGAFPGGWTFKDDPR